MTVMKLAYLTQDNKKLPTSSRVLIKYFKFQMNKYLAKTKSV